VIQIKADAVSSAHDSARHTYGGLTMQYPQFVTEDQASWLRILESRQYEGLSDPITVPDDVLDALVAKGLVRRWRDGDIAITLAGIREVAQH